MQPTFSGRHQRFCIISDLYRINMQFAGMHADITWYLSPLDPVTCVVETACFYLVEPGNIHSMQQTQDQPGTFTGTNGNEVRSSIVQLRMRAREHSINGQ